MLVFIFVISGYKSFLTIDFNFKDRIVKIFLSPTAEANYGSLHIAALVSTQLININITEYKQVRFPIKAIKVLNKL